jgi:hypothetical protein
MNTFGVVRVAKSSIEKLDNIRSKTVWGAKFGIFRLWKRSVFTIANFLHPIKRDMLSEADVEDAQNKFRKRLEEWDDVFGCIVS